MDIDIIRRATYKAVGKVIAGRKEHQGRAMLDYLTLEPNFRVQIMEHLEDYFDIEFSDFERERIIRKTPISTLVSMVKLKMAGVETEEDEADDEHIKEYRA